MKMTAPRNIAAAFGAAALMAGTAMAQAAEVPALPTSPVTINVVDVAGQLALTQKIFEAYQKSHPKVVSRFVFNKAPAPELPGKLKAQQDAGHVDIDMVLSGTDAVSAGMEQHVWTKILPDYASKFPNLDQNYVPGALDMQKPTEGQAIEVVFAAAGPMLEYAPERVKDVPKTTDQLLAWCKAHPNRFMYARPANSGPGRAFLQGLPYVLGDSNPRDPVNGWAKTWAYLKELNSCIEYYPSGTGPTMKELGEGSRDIIASMPGWDIYPRAIGTVPKSAQTTILSGSAGFKWVSDAQYVAIPKGISKEKLAVALDVIAYILEPKEQAYTWDDGYFYPGPAVKNVPISMAPQSSQDVLKEFGRPEYDGLIKKYPIMTPLFGDPLVVAFHKWDEEVGAQKMK